jgi:hypothetical protein
LRRSDRADATRLWSGRRRATDALGFDVGDPLFTVIRWLINARKAIRIFNTRPNKALVSEKPSTLADHHEVR